MSGTQLEWAKYQLNTNGRVSRNDAHSNRITRLAAIVGSLNKNGWQIVGHWERTPYGKDYIYEKRNRHFQTANEANEFLKTL